MYKIKIDKLLQLFDKINKLSDNNIIEMSVKRSRINFEFKDGSLIYSKVILGLLNDGLINEDNLYITTWENNIRVTCDTSTYNKASEIPKDSLFKEFFNLIEELGDHICQCPSLEYIVSTNFVKIYIDKPSMSITDLIDLKKVFDQTFTMELSKQRPYCLFVGDFDKAQTQLSMDELKSNNHDTIGSVLDSEAHEPQILTSDVVRKIL